MRLSDPARRCGSTPSWPEPISTFAPPSSPREPCGIAEDQRQFVSQVRSALADDVERGEPLQPVRLRDRGARAREKPVRSDDLTL